MKSRWFDLKPTALALRKSGLSIPAIESRLGIPRSTLSGWFKNVQLDDTLKARLQKNKEIAWAKARANAALWHKAQKAARIAQAEHDAKQTLSRLTLSNEVLELAFAMLYLGEGAKKDITSLASSEPKILIFCLHVLEKVYGVNRTEVRFDLHLRMDQDIDLVKKFWSEALSVPITSFRYIAKDKRTEGRPTHDHYKGVCVLVCGKIAIQRKLIALYNLFCDKVSEVPYSEGN